VGFFDAVRVSLRGLAGNKLRSLLTMLGVLIGVGAVIVLVAVGDGSSASVQDQIKALGTNTITVTNTGRFGRGGSTSPQTQASTITAGDVKTLSDPSEAPDVKSVNPVVSSTVDAVDGVDEESATVTGSTPGYLTAEDDVVEGGSGITSAEVASHAAVVVIGQTLVSDLFAVGANPIGQTIQLGSANFQVVGVLATKGSSSGTTADPNDVAIVPYTTAEDQLTGYSLSFDEIIVQSKSSSDIDAAEGETAAVLAAANDTTVADLPFNIVNEDSLLSTSKSTNSTFTVLLAAVAAISLLVGGIGIMNIMLVTVTERTREIGIRKAIGAPRSAILGQFLTEAIIVSVLGGLAGVAVGVIGSRFRIDGIKPVLSVVTIFEAFGVSTAIGVFFGFYPAQRAASLRPIDALRYE
jgi:putative ABC transport system permease protein